MTGQSGAPLGFCEFCGAKRVIPGQRYCESCGREVRQLSEATLSPVPAVAAAATPAAPAAPERSAMPAAQVAPEAPVASEMPVTSLIPPQSLASAESLAPTPLPATPTPQPAPALDEAQPQEYGSAPGSSYAPTPARRNAVPLFLGLGIFGLVLLVGAGAL